MRSKKTLEALLEYRKAKVEQELQYLKEREETYKEAESKNFKLDTWGSEIYYRKSVLSKKFDVEKAKDTVKQLENQLKNFKKDNKYNNDNLHD